MDSLPKKKKILLLSSWFPNVKNPLDGNFIEQFAHALTSDFEVDVFYVTSDKTAHEVCTSADFYTQKISYFKTSNSKFIRLIRKVKTYLNVVDRSVKYDYIFCNILYPVGWIAVFYKWMLGIPIISFEHHHALLKEHHHRLSFFKRKSVIFIANQCDLVLPVSNFLKQGIETLGVSTPVEILPNAIDSSVFCVRSLPKNEVTTFVHISNFIEKIKNVKGIIDAVKILSAHRQDFKLIIAGDGDSAYLKEYSQSVLGTTSLIEFRSHMNQQQVASLLQSSDACILNSFYEAQGLILLESIFCGTPVISTPIESLKEYINEHNGLLTAMGNPHKLAEVMEWMIVNGSSYFDKEQVRRSIYDQFSKEAVVKRLLMYLDTYSKSAI